MLSSTARHLHYSFRLCGGCAGGASDCAGCASQDQPCTRTEFLSCICTSTVSLSSHLHQDMHACKLIVVVMCHTTCVRIVDGRLRLAQAQTAALACTDELPLAACSIAWALLYSLWGVAMQHTVSLARCGMRLARERSHLACTVGLPLTDSSIAWAYEAVPALDCKCRAQSAMLAASRG